MERLPTGFADRARTGWRCRAEHFTPSGNRVYDRS